MVGTRIVARAAGDDVRRGYPCRGYPCRGYPWWLALFLLTLLAACKSTATGEPTRLSVFAASSLTEAFHELERGFEARHAGIDVVVTLAGSQVLRLQIEQGAPADVFASANRAHMDALVQAGVVNDSTLFASNELVVIVPKDNPGKIQRFTDLPQARSIIIGNESVPVGAYTRELLDRAAIRYGEAFTSSIRARVVSEESNVRLVRAKVEMGEAEAAIVYRTDATRFDDVRIITIPHDLGPRAHYPIARVTRTDQPALAESLIAYVQSTEGRNVLSRHGFLAPP